MIVKSRALDPSEVPDSELIVHRGDQLADVRVAVKKLTAHRRDSPWLLFGPPGTGKTMIAKFVLDEHATRDGFQTAYVDCWEHYSANALLAQVVDQLDLAVVHHNSTPTTRLVDALQEAPADGTERVVVLDEVDMVEEPEALAALDAAPQLAVIGITNEVDSISDEIAAEWDGLPGRRKQLHFPQYTISELTQILQERADHGLRRAVEDRRLEEMAQAAAGDARLGICILRAAARDARHTISADHVERAESRARKELHEAHLERLTDHQRELYDVIREGGPINTKAARAHYVRRVASEQERSLKTIRKYLNKMETYKLVTADGATRNRGWEIDTSGYVDPELA